MAVTTWRFVMSPLDPVAINTQQSVSLSSDSNNSVEYDTYPYYEGDPIATSRSYDIYNPKKAPPPRLEFKEASDKIKQLQIELFFL
jgi:hypothetical protein